MDGRVKPGHDGWKLECRLRHTPLVMPGLEPGIHAFLSALTAT
jgi:hypothetical protein